MRQVKWVSAIAGLVGLLFAAPCFADGPATEGALQIGLGFRYGAELNQGDFNPWGTGLGLEVGYTLPVLPIYVGGNLEYFFGNEVTLGGVPNFPGATQKGNLWQMTAEGGYDFGVGDHLVIRPKLGLGFADTTLENCIGGCTKDSTAKAVIAPGAKFILMFSHFELAFDGRYDVVLADPTAKAFIFSLGVGF